jgi:predicted DNA-binding protein
MRILSFGRPIKSIESEDNMGSKSMQLSIRLPEDVLEHVDILADETGHTRSDIVRVILCKASLNDLPQGWISSVDETREARRVR